MLSRYGTAALISSGITFGLFFIMHLLIATGKAGLTDNEVIRFVDIVQSERDEEIRREDRKPDKPAEPEQPPDLDTPEPTSLQPDQIGVNMSVARVSGTVDISGGLFGGAQDGEYLPIVKVAPIYPRRAAERGVEGYVILEFTVTELGTVEDPVVIEAEPKGYFERAAIAAAKKFKYKPKVVNGEPQRVAGVRNQITFELTE